MTKHCSRDKESVAKSHRHAIIGTHYPKRPGSARTLLSAAAVVNLARLRPMRQRRLNVWIRKRSSWLSGVAKFDGSLKIVMHALSTLW